MEPTIALAIPHAAHKSERRASLERLLEQLEGGAGRLHVFGDREHYTAWSKKVWGFLETSECTYGLQLQDDTIVAPNFWRVLRAMLAIVPDEVICLESAHPAAPLYHLEGRRWFTTSDMLIGNAYVAPRDVYRDFRIWRETRLKPGALETITEDTLFGLYCLVTGRKIWCPVPTIVDHDLAVPSTCGNDAHPNRRPRIRWDNAGVDVHELEHPSFWCENDVPHVGRGYGLTPQVAMQWVTGLTDRDFVRMFNDDGRLEVKRAQATAKTKLPREAIPRVVLATPTRGGVSAKYAHSIVATMHRGEVELVQPWDHSHWWLWSEDIIRVRSRMVREFLRSGATHLWFVDDDVSFDPALLGHLLAAGRDFVAVPYPSKRIDWASVGNWEDRRSAEARAYKFDNFQPLAEHANGAPADAAHCVEIARIGLGCALLTRKGLEQLIEQVRGDWVKGEQLYFDDAGKPTWALFAQRFDARMENGKRVIDLLVEDLAFCDRWRESGQKVWCYLGPGSPASHDGTYTFRGLPESLGARPAPLASPGDAPRRPVVPPADAPLSGDS